MDLIHDINRIRSRIFECESDTFGVHLNGKKIDTIRSDGKDPDAVRKSLIDYDGYDPRIVVKFNEGRVPLDSESETNKIKKLMEQDDEYPDVGDAVGGENTGGEDKEDEGESDVAKTPSPKEGEIEEPLEKEYVGKSEDIHYYMISIAPEDGTNETPSDLQIVDQEGVIKFSAHDRGIESSDPTGFLINAIKEVEIDEITRSIFTKYILPRLEEDEEDEEEKILDDENSEDEEEEEEEEEGPGLPESRVNDAVEAPVEVPTRTTPKRKPKTPSPIKPVPHQKPEPKGEKDDNEFDVELFKRRRASS